ncbi:energy transducer TonB [bacterium]|nr:energy transducer TonB [bacterium]MBU1072361.1 energy transducer TonB [bacterium]MBU1677042.1 energy transducer TonB [bacterium]
MTTATYRATSANELFKAKYNRYIRWSLIAAIVFTILFFLFSPKYKPNPYRIYKDEMLMVDVQTAIDIPDIPQETLKPQVAVEAAPDDMVDDETEVADSLIDSDEFLDIGSGLDEGGSDFEVSQDKPVLISFAQPDYPEIARASQLEGTVLVKVQVGTDGTVLQAVVIKSVHPTLDREALKAARRCKFKPGRQRDIPVKAWMAIPFAFKLH